MLESWELILEQIVPSPTHKRSVMKDLCFFEVAYSSSFCVLDLKYFFTRKSLLAPEYESNNFAFLRYLSGYGFWLRPLYVFCATLALKDLLFFLPRNLYLSRNWRRYICSSTNDCNFDKATPPLFVTLQWFSRKTFWFEEYSARTLRCLGSATLSFRESSSLSCCASISGSLLVFVALSIFPNDIQGWSIR